MIVDDFFIVRKIVRGGYPAEETAGAEPSCSVKDAAKRGFCDGDDGDEIGGLFNVECFVLIYCTIVFVVPVLDSPRISKVSKPLTYYSPSACT